MVLVASETGHIYTHATPKFQPMLNSKQGRKLIKTCLESDKGEMALTESISDETPAIEIIENIDRGTDHESDDSLHEEAMNVVEIQNRPNFKSINALVGQNISDSDQPVANIPLVTSQLRQRVAPQSNLQQSSLPISEKLCTTIGPPRHLEEYRTISSVPVSLRLTNHENPNSLEFSYLAQNEHHTSPNPMLHRTLRASASPKLFKAASYLNHNDNR